MCVYTQQGSSGSGLRPWARCADVKKLKAVQIFRAAPRCSSVCLFLTSWPVRVEQAGKSVSTSGCFYLIHRPPGVSLCRSLKPTDLSALVRLDRCSLIQVKAETRGGKQKESTTNRGKQMWPNAGKCENDTELKRLTHCVSLAVDVEFEQEGKSLKSPAGAGIYY